MATLGSTSGGSNASASAPPTQQFIVKTPAGSNEKKYSLMKFNQSLNMTIENWENVDLVREDNRRVFGVGPTDEPEFGAGSEYGKKDRDEARRKKLGMISRRYKHENQPWTLTNDQRRYKGMREGGAGTNADYWVFVKTQEGVFEAHHIHDWYQFLPLARHKTLDIDEAEEQFKTRHRVMNTFALKASLKLGGEDEDAAGSVKDDKSGVKKSSFKISDRDEYASGGESDDEFVDVKPKSGGAGDSDDDEDGGAGRKGGGKKGDKGGGAGRKKGGPSKGRTVKKGQVKINEGDEIAVAESDDGDEEGEEVDYMSDSGSEPEEEDQDQKEDDEMIGVDEEKGLRTILSDNEDDEEDEKEKISGLDMKKINKEKRNSDSESSDSDDPDETAANSAVLLTTGRTLSDDLIGGGTKRKAGADGEDGGPSAKKEKRDEMEEEVYRYLMRQKMTTKELLAKFKPKGETMTKELKTKLVNKLAEILKKAQKEFDGRFEKTHKKVDGDKKTLHFFIKPA